MTWSFKLGRFFGIDVFVHFTFVLVLALIGVAHAVVGQSALATISGVAFFLCLFLCVLLHEYGHALAARRFGIGTHDITLLPIGGVARLERMPERPGHELWIALAGPAVNVAIAALLAGWLSVTGSWQPVDSLGLAAGSFAERLLAVNVFLVIFNLLPAFPMDGGRVLRALLSLRMDGARATNIAAGIGKGMAVLFAVLGLIGNPMLLFIALFVWLGASQEAAAMRLRSVVSGAPVRDAMVTRFRTVSSDTSLRELSAMLLADAQQDFPVVENGHVVGMLAHADIIAAIHERELETPIGAIMRTSFATVEENEFLDNILSHERDDPAVSLPVMRAGRLIGLLTNENLHEYFTIRQAQRARSQPPPRPRTSSILRRITTHSTSPSHS